MSKEPANQILNLILNNYHITLEEEILQEMLEIDGISERNRDIVQVLLLLKNDECDDCSMVFALALFSIFDHPINKFKSLSSKHKVKIIHYLLSCFTNPESIEHVDGFQSEKKECASFLRDSALSLLEDNALFELQDRRGVAQDIWTPRIVHELSMKKQKEADVSYSSFEIDSLKKFIFSYDIHSKEDFFIDITSRLKRLSNLITANRKNEKKLFQDKDENGCRDVVVNLLEREDYFSNELDFIREKHEGDNRVDINIKHRTKHDFEVQVECKNDGYSRLYESVKEQLIDKYMKEKVKFGIYLVFLFGKKNKEEMMKKLVSEIPSDYQDNIEVVCFDLS